MNCTRNPLERNNIKHENKLNRKNSDLRDMWMRVQLQNKLLIKIDTFIKSFIYQKDNFA